MVSGSSLLNFSPSARTISPLSRYVHLNCQLSLPFVPIYLTVANICFALISNSFFGFMGSLVSFFTSSDITIFSKDSFGVHELNAGISPKIKISTVINIVDFFIKFFIVTSLCLLLCYFTCNFCQQFFNSAHISSIFQKTFYYIGFNIIFIILPVIIP